MKKFVAILSLALLTTVGAKAQDIYEMEMLSTPNLNGTARYVGMGGAMAALGADMSTMATNPAGTALYRRSDVAGTLGFISQQDGMSFDGHGKSRMSWDNLGAVFVINGDEDVRYFNVGLNYHKSKNFHQLLNGFTQNANYASQTWQMADLASRWANYTSDGLNTSYFTPLTNMGYETYLIGEKGSYDFNYFDADANYYDRAIRGASNAFDINLSTNVNDRYYFGLGIGVEHLNYKSTMLYSEDLLGNDDLGSNDAGYYSLFERNSLKGYGVNIKLGTIIRPVEDSPFRFGIGIVSPTYYSLERNSMADMETVYSDDPEHSYDQYADVEHYKYCIRTPWKFNLSLGHVFGGCVAVGAEYEYADYSSCKVSYPDDIYDNDYFYYDTNPDYALNREADQRLAGVSTFKLGAEWMVDNSFAIRMGYNHVTSPFKKGAFRDQTITSDALDYATTSDYTNLSSINRITAGVGYNHKDFYIDLAYQYHHQNGYLNMFYAPHDPDNNYAGGNVAEANKLNLSRSQVLLTLGFRF